MAAAKVKPESSSLGGCPGNILVGRGKARTLQHRLSGDESTLVEGKTLVFSFHFRILELFSRLPMDVAQPKQDL